MKSLIRSIVMCAAAMMCSGAAGAQGINYDKMTFEDWRAFSVDARREVFNRFTPRKRAEIVRQHISSWRDEHKDKLNGGQLHFIEELLAFATPTNYAERTQGTGSGCAGAIPVATAQQREHAKRLLNTAQGLFTPDQVSELLLMGVDPVPARPGR